MSNITEVTFTSERYAVTEPLYQYDYGQVLKITAPSLPDPYTVHFGNARSSGESLTVLGTASDGAAIPSALLATGLNVYAWVFLHTGENDGETEYMIEIPVIRRAEPTDDPVIEEDPSAVDIIMGEIADLKEDINQIEEQISGGGIGVSDDLKAALLQLAEKVAYIDEDGQDYYDDLYDALYPPIPATGIVLNHSTLTIMALGSSQQLSATLTPSGSTDEVAWSSSDTSVATVNSGGLVTAVSWGTATITATAGSVSATCAVSVEQATLQSIAAVYTQSGTVYDTASLDDLKQDLVVTASWSDSSSTTVASQDYTLSGTLTAGTSVITVSYGGKTTTFNVTVTHYDNSLYNWDFTQSLIDSKQGTEATIGEGVTQSSAGLTFDGSANGWCKLVNMSAYKSTAYTVEMDVTAITYASGNNPTVIGMATTGEGSAADNGLRLNGGRWTFKDNSNNWKTPTQNITGADYFDNSTIKFVVNYSGKTWEVYKDSDLAISYNPVFQTSNNRDVLTIGTSKASQYLGAGTVIKAFRIYAGVV